MKLFLLIFCLVCISVTTSQMNCNQYKTIEGINYTLTTNTSSNISCVKGCLYKRDDGEKGKVCVAKPVNIDERKKQLKTITGPQELKGCPVHNNITMDKKIIAGYYWTDFGNNFPELGCNGERVIIPAEIKQADGTCYPIGSLIVNPGCKVIIFENNNFEGNNHQFSEGIHPLITNDDTLGHFIVPGTPVPCMKIYLTSCKQTYPDCVPRDSWETVVELDNTKSKTKTTFTYTQTIGTTFSSQMTKSFGESITVKAEISAKFFDLLGGELSVASTTNFDWKNMDTATQSESTTTEVSQQVKAGTKVIIQQAVGHCGGSTVNTPLFKTITG